MTVVVEAIVDAVLADLMDRRGVKVPLLELEADDPDMFARMRLELCDKVEAVKDEA